MRWGITGSPHEAQVPGLTARTASCARRMFLFECELRRLGACMTNYFLMLRLSLSGARQFKRPNCVEPRIDDFHAAIAGVAIQIQPAMGAQAATILLAQRTRRQSEQDLLANERAQVHLVAFVQ